MKNSCSAVSRVYCVEAALTVVYSCTVYPCGQTPALLRVCVQTSACKEVQKDATTKIQIVSSLIEDLVLLIILSSTLHVCPVQRQWRIHTTQVIRLRPHRAEHGTPPLYIETAILGVLRERKCRTSQPATRADNSYQDPVRSLCFLRARFGTTCVWNPTASISWRMRSVNR